MTIVKGDRYNSLYPEFNDELVLLIGFKNRLNLD